MNNTTQKTIFTEMALSAVNGLVQLIVAVFENFNG